MICKGAVVGYTTITSKKGEKFFKLWVKVPPAPGVQGEQYGEIMTPAKDGVDPLGMVADVSVDRFGRLNDIQL